MIVKIKKQIVTAIGAILFSTIAFNAIAQENSNDKWIAGQVSYYTKNLNLTDKQKKAVNELLVVTVDQGEEIKKTKTGDEQKKALWYLAKERNDKLSEILTREQNEKLKELKAATKQGK